MITNDRQYRITKAQLSRLREASDTFSLSTATKRLGSEVLAKAEWEALKSEEEVLVEQVREYEALKSGAVSVLKADCLEELPSILIRARISRGLSQRQLAEKLGIKEQQIQRYESEEYASASLRRLTEIARALQLSIGEVGELRRESTDNQQTNVRDIDWRQLPIKEMYRRNWFEWFTGSQAAAMVEAESIARTFVFSALREPASALCRQRVRSGAIMDPFALLAWECRVLHLAKKSEKRYQYDSSSLTDEWFRKLAQESRFEDGPVRAKEFLEKAGILLIIEPHLTHTHLDGAAFLRGGTPIIGLTLRYDRIDNFWFVLFHELIHVVKHLRKGKTEAIFDDMEAEPDQLELEADNMAKQKLIFNQIWEKALARYVRSKDSIISLANEQQINPAIVAGRIRNEANNYVILNDMVGQGQVRKHFPEINFGK
jgi:HTH-type transcriptional regulator / antitoxin HigA